MNFRQGLSLGLKSYSKALSFIFKHKLAWYFIFPLILNIILFTAGYQSTVALSNEYFKYFTEWMNVDTWDFWGSGFLSSTVMFFMNLIVRLLFIIFFAYVGGYVVIILMSPVYAFLSEKVETILTDNEYPFDFSQFIKDILRGVKLALRNFAIEIGLTIVLIFISFIPVVGFFTGFALFLISSYFYGFSFIDFSLERKKMNINHSVTFVKQNKGLAIGNGSLFCLVLMIPYIGVLLSGFLSIVSLVAATIGTTELILKSDTQQHEFK